MPQVYEPFDKIGSYWMKRNKDQMQKENPIWN